MAQLIPRDEHARVPDLEGPPTTPNADEALVQAHQARLAAIVETSDDAIISKNTRGIVLSWNSAAERVFGWTSEDMVGSSILRIIPPELRGEEDRILSMVRAGLRVDHFRTERLRKDGSRVAVSITVSPVKDANGRIIGASKIARDVTSQQQADRVAATLAAIVESSDDAIVSKDLDGRITSWNRAAEQLYGWKAGEIVGKPIFLLIPPHLRSEEEAILARVRTGERIDHFETERVHKDGRRVEVSISISPVRDSTGRIVGASKIARDIGAQREAQREKDRFLAILAHELRNPLAPIRNAVMILRQAGLGPEGHAKALDIAERQIGHMAELLDDLLDVARISSGRVELRLEDLEMHPLIAHAIDAARAQVVRRRHELVVNHPDEPLWIHADPVRVQQIVSNVLNNAIKYTDPGGRIMLGYKRVGDEVAIEVRDSGIGFTHETRDRLFRLFSQAKDATQRADGGLGIGLALVREFTERLGGRVAAESDGLGKGSRFRVWLPLISVPAVAG